MRIAHVHPHSDIYGPGTRFVIWTQGCSIRCPGCWNTAFWSFKNGGSEVAVQDLIQFILAEGERVEGVTVLGGEPFDQPLELLNFLQRVRDLELSIMVYSGYTHEELIAAGNFQILSLIDILIDGRYDPKLRNTNLRWRGSENQRILRLSNRHQNLDTTDCREIEVILNDDGAIVTYGYPD